MAKQIICVGMPVDKPPYYPSSFPFNREVSLAVIWKIERLAEMGYAEQHAADLCGVDYETMRKITLRNQIKFRRVTR